MLVLTREAGEAIIIGHSIRVTVLDIDVRHRRVKLGFIAPSDVAINREEVEVRLAEEGSTTSSEGIAQCPTP